MILFQKSSLSNVWSLFQVFCVFVCICVYLCVLLSDWRPPKKLATNPPTQLAPTTTNATTNPYYHPKPTGEAGTGGRAHHLQAFSHFQFITQGYNIWRPLGTVADNSYIIFLAVQMVSIKLFFLLLMTLTIVVLPFTYHLFQMSTLILFLMGDPSSHQVEWVSFKCLDVDNRPLQSWTFTSLNLEKISFSFFCWWLEDWSSFSNKERNSFVSSNFA